MAIVIGAAASDRPTFNNSRTIINKTVTATGTGTITSVEIWAETDMTGVKVATFYRPDPGSFPNHFTTRDDEAIAGTITAGSKVTKTVSLNVVTGDYIGIFWSGGNLERTNGGANGEWGGGGGNDYIPCTNQEFDPHAEAEYSLYGTGGGPQALISTAVIATSITSALARGVTAVLASTSNIATSITSALSRGITEALISTSNIVSSITALILGKKELVSIVARKWSGIEMCFEDVYDTSNFNTYFDTLVDNGFTQVRIHFADWAYSEDVDVTKTAALAAINKGLDVVWGVSSANTTLTSSNIAAWHTAMDSYAAWAQANGIYEFCIGNELEVHNDDDTLTDLDVRNAVRALATSVQAIYTIGKVTYSNRIPCLADWISEGKGDLDSIGWFCYRDEGDPDLDYWMEVIDTIMAEWTGDEAYISEWNLDSGGYAWWEDKHPGSGEAGEAVGITEMIDYFKASGLTKAFFFYYTKPQWYGENVYEVRKENDTYRLLWNSLLHSDDRVVFTSILSRGITGVLVSTSAIATSITSALSRGVTELLTSTSNMTTSITSTLSRGITQALTSTSNLATSIIATLSKGISTALTSTANIAISTTSSLSRGITQTLVSTSAIISSITARITRIAVLISTSAIATSITGILGRGVTEALTSTVTIATSIISTLSKGITQALLSTAAITVSILAELVKIPTRALYSTAAIVTSTTSALSRGVTEALTSTSAIVTSIASTLSEGITKLLNSTVSIGVSITSALTAVYHWIKVTKVVGQFTKVTRETGDWTKVNREEDDWDKVDKE